MKSDVLIRPSRDSDVPAIADIYRQNVIEGTGSFEVVPPEEEEIARRREDVLRRGCPWLIAEIDGVIVGFAYAGPFRAREAYRFTVEDSVYVRPETFRRGIGRLLLEKLIEECRQAGDELGLEDRRGRAAARRAHRPSWRAASSFMISSLPPPIIITFTSR